MKTIYQIILLIVISISCTTSKAQPNAVGYWKGELSVQGQTLPIAFNISKDNAALKGTMDSPAQGAFDIPCDKVTQDGKKITIKILQAGITFEAELKDDELKGDFQQAGMNLPLTLTRQAKKEGPKAKPQEPKKPYPYQSSDVKFENKKAEIKLAGTLTLPKDVEKAPVAILISGSGPQDRNEALLGHKPFLVIADHLTRQGIAVLRFDDRGTAESEGDFSKATSADFAEDVRAAIAFLKQQEGINPKKIGLIGHSEGGLIAPMVAANNKDVAFIISMAGPGMSLSQLLPAQTKLIQLAEGSSEEEAQKEYESSKKMMQLASSDISKEELSEKVTAMLKEAGMPEAQIKSTVKQMNSPWFRFVMKYDPVKDWQKVKCPVLAINGEKDVQVPAKDNLSGIEKALKKAKNKDVTTKKIEGLNHLFQHSETGAFSEYGQLEETFDPATLELMSSWIKERF